MGSIDPVRAPSTDPAYATADQDAEASMTAPEGERPDAGHGMYPGGRADSPDAADADDEA